MLLSLTVRLSVLTVVVVPSPVIIALPVTPKVDVSRLPSSVTLNLSAVPVGFVTRIILVLVGCAPFHVALNKFLATTSVSLTTNISLLDSS